MKKSCFITVCAMVIACMAVSPTVKGQTKNDKVLVKKDPKDITLKDTSVVKIWLKEIEEKLNSTKVDTTFDFRTRLDNSHLYLSVMEKVLLKGASVNDKRLLSVSRIRKTHLNVEFKYNRSSYNPMLNPAAILGLRNKKE